MTSRRGTLRGLFIVPSDLEDLERKGVLPMILERSEEGFLERVFTLHPAAQHERVVEMAPGNTVVELYRKGRSQRGLWSTIGLFINLCRAVYRACAICRREEIDFIRAQDPYYCGLIGWLAATICRLPFCISIHADYDQRFALDGVRGAPTLMGSRSGAKRLERFLYRRCDLLFPIRDNLGREARLSGVPRHRIVTLPHAIDMDEMAKVAPALPDPIREFGRNRTLLLFTGRLSRENYVDDIIDAARALSHRNDWAIVMMGPGPETERLRETCAGNRALARTVMVAGPYERSVVRAAQRAADIGLCLMGGFSIIEFCALGTPVMSYDVEWHGEMVVPGETGALIPEGDVPALVAAVQLLLDDGEVRSRMGQAAQQRARRRHDIATLLKHRCAAYLRLVGRADPAAC